MDNKSKYVEAMDEIKASDALKRETLFKIKENRPKKRIYKLANAMMLVLIILGVIFITDEVKIKENLLQNPPIKSEMNLPTVGNMQNLIKLLQNSNSNNYYNVYSMEEKAMSADTVTSDYSKTNIQVAGVDEGDIVKTDGTYIYYLSNNKLIITTVGENIKIVNETIYSSSNESEYITPIELYVNNDKLIVILSYYSYNNENYTMKNYVKAIEYEIKDISKLGVYREFEIEGTYVSSRLTNNNLYLVTNKYINTNILSEDNFTLLQKYKDGPKENEYKYLDLSNVCYIPNSETANYLNIISFEINTKRDAKIETILGSGSNIYMSNSNIYVLTNKYKYDQTNSMVKMMIASSGNTLIYKFGVNGTSISYIATKEIPGQIVNQFSLDEYNENLRIATTTNIYSSDNSKNNIYVLDKNLNVIGKLEDLAKGEKIYSVRFMEKKAYVVTYKQVDPLFAIDLSNATAPVVLGELKIPGYSTYLHPYDETHIIGFGQDTKTIKDYYGSDRTVTTGMKMALFDVSDVSSPKELFNTKIGDSGTYSEILTNHKALLFSKEKGIIAFPISITRTENVTDRTNLEFQGAIVYSVDLKSGFNLKGKIAHREIKNNDYFSGYDSDYYIQSVQRIISVGYNLYTLSPGTIKVTDMSSMKEIGRIEMKVEDGNRMGIFID